MGKNKAKASSKKKSKNKARKSINDPPGGDAGDDGEALLLEEITALSAIFQDDFEIVSDRPGSKELTINLRPHSDHDSDFSAQLHVRCFRGYPWKAPKLRIVTSDQSLEAESRILHETLVEQAALSSREGRVMVYNLAEAALEYFSECLAKLATQKQEAPKEEHSGVKDLVTPDASPVKEFNEAQAVSSDSFYCDLWGEHDGSWESPESVSHREKQRPLAEPGTPNSTPRPPPLLLPDIKPQKPRGSLEKLQPVDSGAQTEDSENVNEEEESSSEAPRTTSVTEFLQRLRSGHFKVSRGLKESLKTPDIAEETPWPSPVHDEAILSIQKDLVLAYLLRIICGKRGPLSDTLPVLTSQLLKLGIIPSWAEDLVVRQPQLLEATFKRIFQNVVRANVPDSERILESFWNASPELLGDGEGSFGAASRYLSDFEELCMLGKGGFGHVVLCKNNLDGRRYAMKKVRLKDKNPSDKILREVATLSRLQHQHVVRYYQAWHETTLAGLVEKLDGEDFESSGGWPESLSTANEEKRSSSSTFLFIQMEYCPRTLKEVFETQSILDKDLCWGIFRQIVEGLAHIHGHGIVHRDLTPSNIFFDTRNDVKIGDFGLAKFTDLENPDPEVVLGEETNPRSVEGTGQVGTYFYRAPEVEQAWPHIDEKVDMFSLGVILFELWHPFNTAMERYVILNDLKQNNILPPDWLAKFPQQATLVRLLLSPHPNDRPSARDVLQSDLLPPRMEDEALKDILRTIQSAENSSVYDQVIAAIFDEERLALKLENAGLMNLRLASRDSDFHTVKWLKAEEQVVELTKEVFTRHGAHNFQSSSIDIVAQQRPWNRSSVKVINSSGNMLELRYDSRRPFAEWIVLNQCTSWKRYEISHTFRKGIGNRAPKQYLQGDFDIVGGFRVLAEAQAIKVMVEVISGLPAIETYEIRLNHHEILNAIWHWCGVSQQQRKSVAQILATTTLPSPQSTDRKAKWVFARRQLLQGLHLPEAVVDRLQTAERRFSGNADEVLARLRGALTNNVSSVHAIEELSKLLSYMRIWNIDKPVLLDVFMAPADCYYDGIFFQFVLPKGDHPKINPQDMLVAVGGRYDSLLEQFCRDYRYPASTGAVGLTIALQKLVYIATEDSKSEQKVKVLVCSRGGGGLLKERMEVADELWSANVKADFVCATAPSMTEQYEYAHENGIKWLVIITESGLSQSGLVKVRHLDLKVEVDVARDGLAKFFTETVFAMSLKKMSRQGFLSAAE